MKKTLQEIAEYVGGRVEGDASIVISGLDNIEGAGEHDLTFAVDPHIEEAKACRAAAVMLPEGVADFPKTALYVEEPRAAFARLLELFTPMLQVPTGVSEQAHIGKDVKLGKDVVIMPFAVVDDHAVIGDRVTLYPHTYIGQYAEIEEDTVIYSSATVREHCHVGKRCVIHCSAVIGSDGFGYEFVNGRHEKVPQVGIVILGDDVEIGANTTLDRARFSCTRVGTGTKIDNLVQVGHNVVIGKHCIICAQVGISGSTTLEDYVVLGGQAGLVGHITVDAGSQVGGQAGVPQSLPPKSIVTGNPPLPLGTELRLQLLRQRLPELFKRVSALEAQLGATK